ncbi:MAG TPA: RNA polymerase sigma factor [Nocardioidaceae bacterium]|nr:RNA polymerase sigma factor [Nocardioidaceae bacterium]
MSDSDVELWRGLCVGDPAALTAIYERHIDAVYNFVFRRTASWSTAEDAVQATFGTLWRRARGGDLTPLRLSSARPLLLTMAGHECANLLRSQRRRSALLRRLRPTPDTVDHAPLVAERLDDERQMSEVRRAMRRLPRSQRDAIELVVWSQLSVAEAASVLGVAEGTVKSRLFRGRQRLAGLLRVDVAEEGTQS